MNTFFKKNQTKISIGVAIIMFVVTGLAAHQKLIDDRKEMYARSLLMLLANGQQKLSDEIWTTLKTWALDVETNPSVTNNPCSSQTVSGIKTHRIYNLYRVVNKNGISVCSSTDDIQPNVDLSNDVEFQEFMTKKGRFVTDFRLGINTEDNVLVFGYPVFNKYNREYVDYGVFVGLHLDELNQLVGELGLPKGTDLMLTDSEGRILLNYPTDSTKIGTSSFGPKKLSIILAEKDNTLKERGEDGVIRTYVYHPIRLLDTKEVHMFIILGIPN